MTPRAVVTFSRLYRDPPQDYRFRLQQKLKARVTPEVQFEERRIY